MSEQGEACEERERMVTAAVANGWVQRVAESNAARHALPPVVVVAADGAADVPGAFGGFVRGALEMLATQPAAMREAQRDAGCPPFVVFGVPLVVLCQMVPADLAEDLRMASRGNEYAVLCINGGRTALVSGISWEPEVVA